MSLRSKLGLSLATITAATALACGPKPGIFVGEVPYEGHKYNVMLSPNVDSDEPYRVWISEWGAGNDTTFDREHFIYVEYKEKDNSSMMSLDGELIPTNPLFKIFNGEDIDAITTRAKNTYTNYLIWQAAMDIKKKLGKD